MIVKDVTTVLEELAPLANAEDFDNVGLLVGNYLNEVSGILVTLDTLENVVDEAIEYNCNLIVSFHPIIFSGLKKINGANYVERVAMKAIKHDISIYSMHTALDNSFDGVNAKICEVLGLQNRKILIPKNQTDQYIGMGMIGSLPLPTDEADFLKQVKKTMNASSIRHSKFLNKKIKKVAVLGGSGSFAIAAAKEANADILITADLKYHDFFKAESKILLADIGHFETEQFTKNLLVDYLTEKIPNFAVRLSESKTNPIKYL